MNDDDLLRALLSSAALTDGERSAFDRMRKALKRGGGGALTQRQREWAQSRAAELNLPVWDPGFVRKREVRSAWDPDPESAGARARGRSGHDMWKTDRQPGSGRSTTNSSGSVLKDMVRASRRKGGLTDADIGRMFGITADRVRELCAATPAEAGAEARRRVRGTR